jgi:hypothetical protein
MMKHASNWIKTLSTLAISEKFDGKGQPIFQIELSLLMITIHVCKKRNVIYYMYIIGYNSLFLCIMIQ